MLELFRLCLDSLSEEIDLQAKIEVAVVGSMLTGCTSLNSSSNSVKEMVLEFMQLVIKPMVNSTQVEPR